MKLVSYRESLKEQLGIYVDEKIYNFASNADKLGLGSQPDNMARFLKSGEKTMNIARQVEQAILNKNKDVTASKSSVKDILAPVPHPTSCRDAYAFRQHVAAARRNRGVEMIPEFDEYPIFYFTNHNAIQGPGNVYCMPDHFHMLDFELEAAVVIGKKGINIKAEDADQYIAGYMIMNDFSARRLQMEEMKLNLGPAKGKDFSTTIGPWLVTPDELEPFKVPAKPGHIGRSYNLTMKCWVNGQLVSEGDMADMDWTFAEIIERCAYGVNILPGDVIGSGTVGTGCFLELNGTAKRENPDAKAQWLQENDVVEMEITGLGRLKNTIRKAKSDFSILERKKQPAHQQS